MIGDYNENLRGMSNEFNLLIHILKIDNENFMYNSQKEIYGDINWDKFLNLATHHRVFSIIYLKLKGNNYIPQFVIQRLQEKYKENTFQMLKLTKEMGDIAKNFQEDSIPLLFLKGPIIALELYGDISLRTSRDLDVLIPKEKVREAENILIKLGYERSEPLTPLWKIRKHHLTYIHPKKMSVVEVHWSLHPQSINEPKFYELWKRRREKNIANSPINYLGKEDLFLYLVAHGARHGWFRLRWLLDIAQFIDEKVNKENIHLVFNKKLYKHLGGNKTYLGQALFLCSFLFNLKIKDNDLAFFTEKNNARKLAYKTLKYLNRTSQFDFNNKRIEVKNYHKMYIFSLQSKLQKLLFILKLFLPNPNDAKFVKFPKYFNFLYVPLRPIIWLCRRRKI
ncbi:nucleotidyltransferase domain-containing protein [Priestia aryabhattai]|uniref:nucleotidyltransferase domain-containing protein n=1 Tax=Priestia TaxID=2800373 RepID=UPI00263B5D84|nr:nucleotidyltransferase family protein [Priestia megaterium]MDN4861154.1 nucleotidyltransferase family protein [Priestia megaterium]